MTTLKVTHPVAKYQWIDEADYDPEIHTLIEDKPKSATETPPKELPPKGK